MGIKRPPLSSPLFLILLTTTQGLMALKCDVGPCPKGQFYSSASSICYACPIGEYLDQQDHACTQCQPCDVAEEKRNEIKEEACTATANTIIRCKEGYFYRLDGDKGSCEKCTVCDGEVKSPCTKLNDTVCSPKPTAEKKSDGEDDGSKTTQKTPAREEPTCSKSKCSREYGWDP